MTHTHTYAILEISQAAYDEIALKLNNAGYDHAFHAPPNERGVVVIDMHGIALRREGAMVCHKVTGIE